jgi:sugar (glycoside-pentoside-hexuronide) transporter
MKSQAEYSPIPDSVEARPRLGEQLSYVGGEFASNFAWNMVAGYLLYYYTDIAFLPVVALGTLMLVCRVFDAVVDPMVGILVDRTHTRWGQARPYLLLVAIPFAVLTILTFAVPNWTPFHKVEYGYVTFTLLGMCYSLLYIPYGALLPKLTIDSGLTSRISGWRAMATSVASVIVYSIVMPLSNALGASHRREGFVLAATVVAAITAALYLNVFWQCKERYTARRRSTSRRMGAELRDLLRNRVWRFVLLFSLLSFVRLGIMVSVVAYFVIKVMRHPTLMSVVLPLLSVAILTGGFLASRFIEKLGLRRINVAFLLLSVGAYAVMPSVQGNIGIFLVVFVTGNIVGGIGAATTFTACADAVTLKEKNTAGETGGRSEGLIFSTVSFGMKVGMALGAALTAYALSWSGYTPAAPGPQAITMIRRLFYLAPIALSVLQLLVVVTLCYDRPKTAGIAAS